MLLTEAYRAQNAAMHLAKPQYGAHGLELASDIVKLAEACKASGVLDYGCGKGTLSGAISLPVQNYDPAVPEFSDLPSPADLVACCDVMEHVEPDCLDAVIAHLHSLTRKALYVTICTIPAQKHLPDGRNAHLIVQPAAWWIKKFARFREVMKVERDHHLTLVLAP